MNIQTTNNGFNLNSINYIFETLEIDDILKSYKIISDSQSLVGTNEGFVFLDLSLSINNKFFDNINDFIIALKINN